MPRIKRVPEKEPKKEVDKKVEEKDSGEVVRDEAYFEKREEERSRQNKINRDSKKI